MKSDALSVENEPKKRKREDDVIIETSMQKIPEQNKLIAMAFSSAPFDKDFKKDKQQEILESLPPEESTMQGWGSWTGPVTRIYRNRVLKN